MIVYYFLFVYDKDKIYKYKPTKQHKILYASITHQLRKKLIYLYKKICQCVKHGCFTAFCVKKNCFQKL